MPRKLKGIKFHKGRDGQYEATPLYYGAGRSTITSTGERASGESLTEAVNKLFKALIAKGVL